MADEQVLAVAADVADAPVSTEEAPRDAAGRFAPEGKAERSPLGAGYVMPRETPSKFGDVADHLAKAEYVKALEAGHIPPDESMDAATWAKARQAQLSHGTSAIEVPEESSEEPASREQDGDAKETERDQEILDSYHQRKEDFKSSHPDYDEVVGKLELSPDVAPGVELALLELGPAVAYELARNPQLVAELSDLTPAAAVAKVGGIAERMGQAGQLYDSWAQEHLQANIPQHVIADFQKKAAALHSQLTEDEKSMAGVVGVAPHVAKTILAMGRPELIVSLIRDPATAGRLNTMHPMAAAAELSGMARDLDHEPDGPRKTSQAPAPIKPVRKASPTATGLSDDLPIEEWVKRRNSQIQQRKANG